MYADSLSVAQLVWEGAGGPQAVCLLHVSLNQALQMWMAL